MTEIRAFAEDYANALGHVVISYNAMEIALTKIAGLLWIGSSNRAAGEESIQRRLGRRSLDERLSLMATRLNEAELQSLYSNAWLDQLDRQLRDCRPLASERHEVVHRPVMVFDEEDQSSWHQDLDDWESVEKLMALSDALDQQTRSLTVLYTEAGDHRLDAS